MRRLTLSLTLIILCGCSNKTLETGYTYTPLGDSSTQRRGYYADPFSPEARAAQQDRTTDYEGRRPVPGQ
ncbi:MAG: hypothetical protein H7144_04695 [Burkholderiales bacterium]|nr:hypothetical protein [Phycisphaerae bacterium]